MDEAEGFPDAVIPLAQKSNDAQDNNLIQDKYGKPSHHEKIVLRTPVEGRYLVIEEKIIRIDGDERDQEQANNQLRALVFAPGNLFFKLRIKNSRTSLQMSGVMFISNDGKQQCLVYRHRMKAWIVNEN